MVICHLISFSSFYFSPLSVVLKHLDHILVASHELAALVQQARVGKAAFLHDPPRCGVAREMVGPDVFETLHADAMVELSLIHI